MKESPDMEIKNVQFFMILIKKERICSLKSSKNNKVQFLLQVHMNFLFSTLQLGLCNIHAFLCVY